MISSEYQGKEYRCLLRDRDVEHAHVQTLTAACLATTPVSKTLEAKIKVERARAELAKEALPNTGPLKRKKQ